MVLQSDLTAALRSVESKPESYNWKLQNRRLQRSPGTPRPNRVSLAPQQLQNAGPAWPGYGLSLPPWAANRQGAKWVDGAANSVCTMYCILPHLAHLANVMDTSYSTVSPLSQAGIGALKGIVACMFTNWSSLVFTIA